MTKKTKEGEGEPKATRERKPLDQQSMSIDLPGVPAAIAAYCQNKPLYKPSAVEAIVREAAIRAATEAVADVATLVAKAA